MPQCTVTRTQSLIISRTTPNTIWTTDELLIMQTLYVLSHNRISLCGIIIMTNDHYIECSLYRIFIIPNTYYAEIRLNRVFIKPKIMVCGIFCLMTIRYTRIRSNGDLIMISIINTLSGKTSVEKMCRQLGFVPNIIDSLHSSPLRNSFSP